MFTLTDFPGLVDSPKLIMQYVLLGVKGDLRVYECREFYKNVPRSVCNNVKTLRFGICERDNGPFSSIKGGEYLSD